jgi:TPP-dependent pyruvate/acetoin dehydrogenase alpha subunit
VGSLADGAVHEALNLAALTDASVIFLVAVHPLDGAAPLARQLAAEPEALGHSFSLATVALDGNSTQAVHDAVQNARAARGPHLLVARLTPGEDLLARAQTESSQA